MNLSYDIFTGAFLSKVTEYDFVDMKDFERNGIIDGYMKRAIAEFMSVCDYDFPATADDNVREFIIDIPKEEVDELADIISEGMVAQWLKPYTFKQDGLENNLSTKDFTTYSPSELLRVIVDTYRKVQRDFINKVREYSYRHGDLTDLHL